MLVRFENDAIDETPEMSRILSSANPAGMLVGDTCLHLLISLPFV
jgi:hypothetical protein